MIFNSSFVTGLTLSSALYRSPLFINPPTQLSASINFQGLNFKKFIFHALYFDSPLSNIVIHKSNFENFLGRPISIQQVDCTSFYNQIVTNQYVGPCATITYCTFQNMLEKLTGSAICIMYNNEATSLFDHCKFSHCIASENGGALYCAIGNLASKLGNIIVTSSQFELCSVNNTNNNSACGGAIYCRAKTLNLANTTFSYCGINSNASKCCGGAVYANIINAEKAFSYDKFNDCYIKDTSESFGGAIYLSVDKPSDVQILACNFESCDAITGSAIYSEREINLVLDVTRFLSYLNANTVIYLDKINNQPNSIFVKSIGMSNVQINDYFLFINGEAKIMNKNDNSGLLYLDITSKYNIDYYAKKISNCDFSFTFVNYEKYSEMPVLTYVEQQVEEPTTDEPTPQPPQIDTGGNFGTSQSETPNQIVSDQISSATGNATIDEAAGGTKSGGLSTVAIVFIVIACIIFVIGLIIAAVLLLRSKDGCYRNRCTGSDNFFGKSTSYF